MVLKDLTDLRGVSGDEGRVRAYIVDNAKPHATSVTVDRIGNVIARKDSGIPGAKTVLLSAHMDEVGMIVKGIDDNGLIGYMTIGGIDPRVVVSKRVLVGEKGIPGVIGSKAIHLQSDEEYKSVLGHDKLYIDIGAKDRASAEKQIEVGDYVSFDSAWVEFGNGLIKAKALDDRVGCMVLLSILEGTYPVNVVCAFTVDEEIGARGALGAGYTVDADCVLALEGTTANDIGCVKSQETVCELGKGVAISFMDRSAIAHRGLFKALTNLATHKCIEWQIKRFVAGGTDAGLIQTVAGAKPVCVLSAPCRNIHTPSSIVNLNDIESMYLLVEAFLSGGAEFEEE